MTLSFPSHCTPRLVGLLLAPLDTMPRTLSCSTNQRELWVPQFSVSPSHLEKEDVVFVLQTSNEKAEETFAPIGLKNVYLPEISRRVTHVNSFLQPRRHAKHLT